MKSLTFFKVLRSLVFGGLFFSVLQPVQAQQQVLTLSEFLGFVKKFHPVVKQANLQLSQAEAKLMKARGAFDPKLDVGQNAKNFEQKNYFSKLQAAFKIPTWYGIELKGQYENNSGIFLNPEATVPQDGLYSMGVSVPLARGLVMNKRMASLKQAKLYQSQTEAYVQLLVNKVVFEACVAYFNWHRSYRNRAVYGNVLQNALFRFEGVKRAFQFGERPAIDTTEARIVFNSRRLSLEKAQLEYAKNSLELANFLWIQEVPVELQDSVVPDLSLAQQVSESLELPDPDSVLELSNHPKLRALAFKQKSLQIEERLKWHNLLPELNVQYNLLTSEFIDVGTFSPTNAKWGISFSMPLFLRKERAALRSIRYLQQATELEASATAWALQNKLQGVKQELNSYVNQVATAAVMVDDYAKLLAGEERKFQTGESSLFLINSRETKFIESQLKLNLLENNYFVAKAKLFQLNLTAD